MGYQFFSWVYSKPMHGKLIRTVYAGAQTDYFIGNPESSYFSAVYKIPTVFQIQTQPIIYNEAVDWGHPSWLIYRNMVIFSIVASPISDYPIYLADLSIYLVLVKSTSTKISYILTPPVIV